MKPAAISSRTLVPTRMPEALRALQAGKLPRRAGMILVRHGAQYEFTLQAESFAVSGAESAETRRRSALTERVSHRAAREPAAPGGDDRPRLCSLSRPADIERLARRAWPYSRLAQSGSLRGADAGEFG